MCLVIVMSYVTTAWCGPAYANSGTQHQQVHRPFTWLGVLCGASQCPVCSEICADCAWLDVTSERTRTATG